MIKKINHIGIAVSSIEEAVKLYTDVLGLKVKDVEIVADQKVKTAIIPAAKDRLVRIISTVPDGFRP